MTKSNDQKEQEAAMLEVLKSIPKTMYVQLAGCDPKTVQNHAARLSLPLDGNMVDLAAVIRGIHAFAKSHRGTPPRRTLRDDDESMLVGDGIDSPALERWREIRAEREALKLDTELGELVRRDEIKSLMETSAGLIRRCGKTLADQYGQDAATVLAHAIDSVIMHVERELGDPELQEA